MWNDNELSKMVEGGVPFPMMSDAGGKVAVPKTKISDEHGFFAIFIDSEGNKVGLHSMK